MRIEDTKCEGVKLIHCFSSSDQRGGFAKIFNDADYKAAGLSVDIKETYYSISNNNVIRGLHFQLPPYEHAKIVHVIRGSVIDVLLDLRKSSSTYGKVFQFTLSGKTPSALYIPVGLAHGFKTLEDNTMMLYQVTSVYEKESDTGVLFDSIDYDWGIEDPIISKRDRTFVKFKDFDSPF